ncbi:MAG: PKD domain-containing protein [Bacteroidota bacterium]
MEQLTRVKTTLVAIVALIASMVPQTAKSQTALFNANVTSGCEPLTVNFANLSTNATSYYWTFGNGNSSTLANPTTVYTSPGTYTVTLVAINGTSRDTLVRSNYIFVPVSPVPDFSVNTQTGCETGNVFNFTNLTINGNTYTWDFGDGNFSSALNPSHTYASPGTYTVKLIANNSYGCTRVKTRAAYITVNPDPTANYTVNNTTSCDSNTVFQFSSAALGAASHQWIFSNGSTSSQINPAISFGAYGTYGVTLVVTSTAGCSDTISNNNQITIAPPVAPAVSINNQNGCAPFAASFNSTTPDAASWLWDFGDGSTSTVEDPNHTYQQAGIYSVSLTVVTASGCTTSVSLPNYVTVHAAPVPNFTVGNTVSCAPVQTLFTNTSTGAVSYNWTFGNGTTSNSTSPTGTFTISGNYDVTLTATSANGCTASITQQVNVTAHDITAFFTGNPTMGCAPLPVTFAGSSSPLAASWSWSFGDGNTSAARNPSNTYNATGNYNVTLVVTSAQGCKDTLTKNAYIKVVTDTTPYVVPDTMVVCLPPGVIGFTAPNQANNWWSWNFGDGGTASVRSPVHTYTAPGVYTVTLQTSMPGGCSRTYNPFAIVRVVQADTFPLVAITASPCGPYTVSIAPGGPMAGTYYWDFGDGFTSTLPNPTHTYAQQGTYLITLQVTGVDGCEVGMSTVVTFGHANPITVSDNDACTGDVISFGLNPASQFVSASWDFGDGSTSNQLQPTHTYLSAGYYPVSVTIVDVNGCTYTYAYPTLVKIGDPQPSFTFTPNVGCVPFQVQFTNTSTGATSYSWNFGAAGSSTMANPNLNVTAPGLHNVTLNATMNGCTRSYTVPNAITANQAQAFFNFTPTTGCLPLTASFNDNSVNPVSWFWEFGDGATSTLQNPTHTFTAVPDSNVRLTITDINGCVATRVRTNVQPVVPVIQFNDSTGCRPLMVNFTTPTVAASYIWDFGDGTTSTLQNPNHLYVTAGNFTVTLNCVLASGCTATTVMPALIDVNAPVSDFYSPTAAVCAPSLVNFVNQSTGATSWKWDFGDGTTSTNENPAHIYHLPGVYTVTLISFSAEGCSDTLVKLDYVTVPGTYSEFTMANAVNCFNTAVQFVDLSIGATNWFWNFGDGFTSTMQNPTHTYQDSGSYTVTLITSNSTGCSSFYTLPNPITIYPLPEAIATVSSAIGCHPLSVSFSNQSVNANSYHWDFGNGDTSNLATPNYNYTAPGSFQVQLIAFTNMGCADTLVLPGLITVHPTPAAAFTTSGNAGCSPYPVAFTNNSTFLSGPTYNWIFGSGANASAASPSYTYADSGNYQVTLVIVNQEGCSDTATANIQVNLTPTANAAMVNTLGCAPIVTSFSNLSLNADSIVWHFGDGTTSVDANPSHQYAAGNYNPFVVAYSNAGCRDTFMLPGQVVVHPVPTAAFTASQNAGCPGSTFTMQNQSTPATGLVYTWNIAGAAYSAPNPSVVLTTPGFYDASLVVTNQFGCSDTLVNTAYIEVYDTLPPPLSPILSVSVVDDQSVEIVWQNTAVSDFGAYRLFRKNNDTGLYTQVYSTTTNPVIGPGGTSSFIDNGLNTLRNTYTYKLQTEDRCAYVLPLSASVAHTTINVTATAVSNNIRVEWTPYGGCQVATYELERLDLTSGIIDHVASLPGTVTSYNDLDFPCPFPYSYRVRATDLCGNTYVSWSDTSAATPANILAGQKVDVVRSTVVDDQDVLTEWAPPALRPDRVKEYKIFRSEGNTNFTEVARVPAGTQLYRDSDVDVHKTEYFYRIEIITDCDLVGEMSNQSSSIFLQSDYDYNNFKSKLWWTPYNAWDTGVDYYVIEKLNGLGTWDVIRTVDGNSLDTTFDE